MSDVTYWIWAAMNIFCLITTVWGKKGETIFNAFDQCCEGKKALSQRLSWFFIQPFKKMKWQSKVMRAPLFVFYAPAILTLLIAEKVILISRAMVLGAKGLIAR